jgi:hypothetical protein
VSLVDALEPGGAKNRAAGALLEHWIERAEMQVAIHWLATVNDADARKAALEKVQWNWMWKDPDGVLDFIAGPHGGLAPSSLIAQAAAHLARESPEAAIEWSQGLSSEQASQARESIFSTWLQIRPQGAVQWAAQLPPGPQRESAVRAIATHLAFSSDHSAPDWFRSLSPTDRAIARDAVEKIALADDRRAKFLQALDGIR